MNVRYASRKQISSTTTSLNDPCENKDYDKIGNLEDMQRYLFFCEQEKSIEVVAENWGSAVVKADQVWPRYGYFVNILCSMLNGAD